ncbi:UNVERIFIED_CONTAM: hypothetical protein RMT77_014956 [Armadillidium vulgare]
MSLVGILLCLLRALTPDQCILTVPSSTVPSTTVPSTTVPPTPQDCSFPHCHVFKNGNLVLFPGKRNVIAGSGRSNYCSSFNGTIFVPRTEEDNKIWLEFIKMLYDEDKSFKEAWYPIGYAETETFYWLYDTSMDEFNDSDYKLKIDDPNDGQPDFDDLIFTDYDYPRIPLIFFSHDIEIVFGQLQIRDGFKEAGFVVCSPR